jgi:hypothetical protein
MPETTAEHGKARRNRSEAGVYQQHRKSQSKSGKSLLNKRSSRPKQRTIREEGRSRKANHRLHQHAHQGITRKISFGVDGDEEMPGSNVADKRDVL